MISAEHSVYLEKSFLDTLPAGTYYLWGITGTENTLIVGMDIGSMNHFARSFDWRKVECSKKPFPFLNQKYLKV